MKKFCFSLSFILISLLGYSIPILPMQVDIEAVDEVDQCSICFEKFENERVTNCGHHFCKHCISQWRQSQNTCPHCRTEITRLLKPPKKEANNQLIAPKGQNNRIELVAPQQNQINNRCKSCRQNIPGDSLFKTHCNHNFHKQCLTTTIKGGGDTCLCCQEKLTLDEIFTLLNISTLNILRQCAAEFGRSCINGVDYRFMLNRLFSTPVPLAVGACESLASPVISKVLAKTKISKYSNALLSGAFATYANLLVAKECNFVTPFIPRLIERTIAGTIQLSARGAINTFNIKNPYDIDGLQKIRKRHKALKLMKIVGTLAGLYAGYHMHAQLKEFVGSFIEEEGMRVIERGRDSLAAGAFSSGQALIEKGLKIIESVIEYKKG